MRLLAALRRLGALILIDSIHHRIGHFYPLPSRPFLRNTDTTSCQAIHSLLLGGVSRRKQPGEDEERPRPQSRSKENDGDEPQDQFAVREILKRSLRRLLLDCPHQAHPASHLSSRRLRARRQQECEKQPRIHADVHIINGTKGVHVRRIDGTDFSVLCRKGLQVPGGSRKVGFKDFFGRKVHFRPLEAGREDDNVAFDFHPGSRPAFAH